MRSPADLSTNSGRFLATKNESHSLLATLALICGVVAVCFDPQTVRANAGPPIREGQLLAEPIGIRDVHITHETLNIDLRPLAQRKPASVEAVYDLDNRGPEQTLELLFAAGSRSLESFQVWFGDEEISGSVVEGPVQLPASWQPPRQTPDIYEKKGVDYAGGAAPMEFTIVVPPGAHTLTVRYQAKATEHMHGHGHPTIYHQFAYVLAPARAWAGFGELDITIRLPSNWRAACSPTLNHEQDFLKGSFAQLPGDAIALTVQAPPGWKYQLLHHGGLALFVVAVFGGAVFCWWGGRVKGQAIPLPHDSRSSWLKRHAWPRSLGLSVLWGVSILLTALLAVIGSLLMLPAHQSSEQPYLILALVAGAFVLAVAALPIGFVTAQVTALVVLSRRRIHSSTTGTE